MNVSPMFNLVDLRIARWLSSAPSSLSQVCCLASGRAECGEVCQSPRNPQCFVFAASLNVCSTCVRRKPYHRVFARNITLQTLKRGTKFPTFPTSRDITRLAKVRSLIMVTGQIIPNPAGAAYSPSNPPFAPRIEKPALHRHPYTKKIKVRVQQRSLKVHTPALVVFLGLLEFIGSIMITLHDSGRCR
jgi:hypothetical protein